MAFPGATADRAEAAYVVVGAPLDATTSFHPGARFGPRRIRTFAETFDDYDSRTGRRFSDLDVADAGDVRAWDAVAEYLDHLEAELRALVGDREVPLTLGGEHTVTVAGVRAVDPDVLVVLDAHLDLREEYDGNRYSHACTVRRALETVDEAVIVGARTGSEAEWERARDDDVTVVPPEAAGEWRPSIDEDATVYLSVDIDAADPGTAPGTGTMEPFGLSSVTMRDVVHRVAPLASAFDVVEVNDRDDGQAPALAGKLLREFVFAHAAGTV